MNIMDKHNAEIKEIKEAARTKVNQQIEFIEGLVAELLAVNSLEYHNKLWLAFGASPKLLNESKGECLVRALEAIRRLKIILNGGTSRDG